MAESLRDEILALLGDVREHLRFADELGAAGFETNFVATVVEREDRQIQTKKIAASAIESYAPPKSVQTATPKPSSPTSAPARFASIKEKLEATKLSKISPAAIEKPMTRIGEMESNPILPHTRKETNFAAPLLSQGEKKMENSLFGDLTPEKESLPESNETPEDIRADIGDCVRCPLYAGRTKIVHTTGNWQARVLFVGEAPGANEDAEGVPFVGRAGQLLTKIIEAIGLKREEVLIGNVNRCRPPQNRTPTIQEARTCRQFLMREIAVARPEIIVVMGNTACQNLLDTKEGITKLRGRFQDYYGVKVMPTFHPAYLLRDPTKKRETWEDMKKVRDELAKTKA